MIRMLLISVFVAAICYGILNWLLTSSLNPERPDAREMLLWTSAVVGFATACASMLGKGIMRLLGRV